MKQLKNLQSSPNPEVNDDLIDQLTLKILPDGMVQQDEFSLTQNKYDDEFGKVISAETFSDYREYVVDENLLAIAFPEASSDRIRVEREFQASYYVMKKFLNI